MDPDGPRSIRTCTIPRSSGCRRTVICWLPSWVFANVSRTGATCSTGDAGPVGCAAPAAATVVTAGSGENAIGPVVGSTGLVSEAGGGAMELDAEYRTLVRLSVPARGNLGFRLAFFMHKECMEAEMGRGLLLWLLGVPIPVILLLWLFFGR